MTALKSRPNHAIALRSLRAMSPEARLHKAFELSGLAKGLFRTGMARRFPAKTPAELEALIRARLDLCHNRNF